MAGAGKRRNQQSRRGGGSGEASGHDGDEQAGASRPPPGALDGPPSSPSQKSGAGSGQPQSGPMSPGPQPPGMQSFGPQAGSGSPSRPGSSGGPPAEVSRDPGRDPPKPTRLTDLNRNIDLPGSAYNLDHAYEIPTELMARPKVGNTTGKEVVIQLNSFNITRFPNKTVYQYDIQIGSGAEKRGLIKKVWASKTVAQKIPVHQWIFDGNKIAWSLSELKAEVTFFVDFDAEEGVTPRAGKENRHRVTIRKTNPVNLAVLTAYLGGKMSFDTPVLEAINFLDHLMREWPSKQYTTIKRSFFARGEERHALGGGIEAFKGVYQSIRACHGGRLAVNIDVSNGVFWSEQIVHLTVMKLTDSNDIHTLEARLKQVQADPTRKDSPMIDPPTFHILRRLRKVGIYAKHRGSEEKNKLWIIDRFISQTAHTFTFNVKDRNTGEVTQKVSVYTYFQRRYNITLQYPYLPLIQTTKKGVVFPMECVVIAENQRYPFKTDENQTAKMIKFAVTKPDKRIEAVNHGLRMLKWSDDPYLKNYGMEIDPNMVKTKARVLNNPVVQFGGSTINPGVSGRWDLKGKRFLTPNTEPLKSWGVCIFNTGRHKVDEATAKNFIREFIKVYIGHGGIVQNKEPFIMVGPADPAVGVEQLWTKTGNAMMQNQQVMKLSAQYMSNVCMKFNAKLGGTTARVATKAPTGHFTVPSIVIGADVSHAAPGSDQASMAAMTVSLDKVAARYAAACETNGHRVEMITTANIESMLKPLIQRWIGTVGGGQFPQHVYYFRDGVSEGQYQHVLQQEVKDIKALMRKGQPTWNGKLIVAVASKRHHIRFFPKTGDRVAADRNSNPVPGTLVDKDVTHPFEYDFYLNSHSAIQGTARPVHYHILMDEAGISANQFQNMIYEQSYQYMRSTTPVSLFPAVYYAHLASNRARSHENIPASSGPRSGPGPTKPPKSGQRSITSSEKEATEVPPLLPINTSNNLQYDMWYI
ncbi:MAG: hypothetical protein M1827_000171 [Pycnora praestabilis]|nr:MAG: hypothetical protein M1827_000171 [Pycnora praestabilis]